MIDFYIYSFTQGAFMKRQGEHIEGYGPCIKMGHRLTRKGFNAWVKLHLNIEGQIGLHEAQVGKRKKNISGGMLCVRKTHTYERTTTLTVAWWEDKVKKWAWRNEQGPDQSRHDVSC